MASSFLRKRAKKPSFFKVLIEDFTTRLKIPPTFIKEFGKEVPEKTILETYFGKSEAVEVENLGNKFYFHNGWKKFVEDNGLETGDFLVFKYFEDYSKFKVKIYGKTCCEKKQYDVINGKKDKRNVKGAVKRKRDDEEDDNGNKDGESKSKAFESSIINIDSESDDEENDELETRRNRRRSTLPSHYSNQIQLPLNPCFQLELKHSTANFYIYIPTDFLREHMKDILNKRIKFQISQEIRNVEILLLKRGLDAKEVRVTREWKKIAKEYGLKVGDVCIFEMIKSDNDFDNSCVFRIHVYSWDPKKEEFAQKY